MSDLNTVRSFFVMNLCVYPEKDNNAVRLRQHRTVNRSMEHWDRLATSVLKQGYWNRIGNLTRSFDSLPPDIETMFDEIEDRAPVKLNAEQRLMYYAEFTRAALGSTTLHFRDVEALIARKNPEIMLSRIEFLTLLTSKFHELSKEVSDQSETEYIDFKLLAAILYDMIKHYEDMKRGGQMESRGLQTSISTGS